MMLLKVTGMVAIVACLALTADSRKGAARAAEYRSPLAMAVSRDGKTLYVSDKTAGCVAVLDTALVDLRVQESLPMQRGHAEALMPLVARILQSAQLDFADLDRIAVTTGPGSFTGLRVGIAALDRVSRRHRGYVFPQSVYAVELDKSGMHELYLLCILNSEVINEYVRRTATGYKFLHPQLERSESLQSPWASGCER